MVVEKRVVETGGNREKERSKKTGAETNPGSCHPLNH
jgi:hypothetical protein